VTRIQTIAGTVGGTTSDGKTTGKPQLLRSGRFVTWRRAQVMSDQKCRIRFYTFWEWAGNVATFTLYMTIVVLTGGDYLGAALWFFPLLFIIGMGFLASRDKQYEHGKRGTKS
jgi:hypothetical protein